MYEPAHGRDAVVVVALQVHRREDRPLQPSAAHRRLYLQRLAASRQQDGPNLCGNTAGEVPCIRTAITQLELREHQQTRGLIAGHALMPVTRHLAVYHAPGYDGATDAAQYSRQEFHPRMLPSSDTTSFLDRGSSQPCTDPRSRSLTAVLCPTGAKQDSSRRAEGLVHRGGSNCQAAGY